jgi:hypothetical protein
MQFDWRTEEEDPLTPESPRPQPAAPKHRWLIWLSLTAVIILSGFLVYYQLNQRVDAAHAEIEADVLAAFYLAQQALIQGDPELLATVLSRQDQQWYREWQAVAENGRYPPAIPPLLTAAGDVEVVAVHLSSQLDAAEIVWQRPYRRQSANSGSDHVWLQGIDFYHKTNRGWLWMPPEEDYWGDWQSQTGHYLHLMYPERDEAFAAGLATALDDLLRTWCEDGLPAQLECPTRPPWNLRLARNPGALNNVNPANQGRPPTLSASSLPLPALPSPSLLGWPVDEAGQEALRRHYGLQLGTALIQYNVQRYDRLSGRSEIVSILGQMGLLDWPPPVALPLPTTAVTDDMVVHCTTAAGGRLWQYDRLGDAWQLLLPQQSVYEFMPWPGGAGLFLGSREETAAGLQVTFSRYLDGRLFPIYQFQPAAAAHSSRPYEFGRLLRRGQDNSQLMLLAGSVDARQRYWLDGAGCTASDCPLTRLDDTLNGMGWSPDGRYGFVQERNGFWLIDETGEQLRSLNMPGTWLDNERFAYVTWPTRFLPGAQVAPELVIVAVSPDEPDWVIPLADLLAQQGAGQNLFLGTVLANPVDRDSLVLMGTRVWFDTGPQDTRYYFALLELDQPAAKLTLLPTNIQWPETFPTISPDGRWLILIGPRDDLPILELVDLQQEAGWYAPLATSADLVASLPWQWGHLPVTLAPDGRTLAVLYAGIIHLFDLVTGEPAALVPPQPGCMNLAWLR